MRAAQRKQEVADALVAPPIEITYAVVIASVTQARFPSAKRSWFEHDGAAAPFGCLRERFRSSGERIGGSDVDVELALRERRG